MSAATIDIICVALGGAAGSAARYAVSRMIGQHAGSGFPWGTLAVNVAGCAILGILCGIIARGVQIPTPVRLMLTVGFCGGFTTFSTFAGDNIMLMSAGRIAASACYAAMSLTLGLTAFFAAQRLAAAI